MRRLHIKELSGDRLTDKSIRTVLLHHVARDHTVPRKHYIEKRIGEGFEGHDRSEGKTSRLFGAVELGEKNRYEKQTSRGEVTIGETKRAPPEGVLIHIADSDLHKQRDRSHPPRM